MEVRADTPPQHDTYDYTACNSQHTTTSTSSQLKPYQKRHLRIDSEVVISLTTSPLSTPIRRRHSVTSLSPSSSPTSQPSPLKRPRKEHPSDKKTSKNVLERLIQPAMENKMHIKPPNLIIEEGDVWDDLYDMVVQAWQSGENKAIFEKNFDVETWSDDFIILGFSSISLSAFDAIIQRAYAQFGPELVNMILHSETVGSIASVMAWGDVIEYSKTNSREESTDQKGSETFFSPTTMSFAQEGSTQPTTPSPPSPRNRKQKDEDSDSEEGSSDDIKHDSASVNAITYPQWLTELHISALGKGIEIIFTKSYNIEDNSSSIFPAFTEWNNTAGITAAYHGCSLDNDSFVGTFQTFVANGVLAIGNRRRYYSVTPATYWTNSPQYACIWPTIKANLSNWRRIDHIPPPSLLIVVSEPNITSNGLETIVIPQVETLKATEYVNACRNKEFATRRTHPDFPGIESSDFVLAPLPAHTISTMQNSYLGQCIHTHTAIPSISILTAATANAIDYMNRHIKKIIIFGWGQGTIGDTDNINFGTAGIKEGESTYRE